jgi:SAM-dependent methyltransferase
MHTDSKPGTYRDRSITDEKHILPCMLCGSPSFIAYRSLHDRLFDSPGKWSLVRCANPSCGLLWIEPQPSAEQITRAYQDYYTHGIRRKYSFARSMYSKLRFGYLASRFGYRRSKTSFGWKCAGRIAGLIPRRRAVFDASVMWLPAKSGGRLLEIGCGAGENLAHLEKLGWQVLGVEPDPKAAAVARSRGLAVIEVILHNSLFEAESFDAIVMSHVIEHLKNPQEAINICHTLLRPGGRLVMLTPNTDALGHRWYREDWLHLDPPRHLNLFNTKSIHRLTNGAGFIDYRSFTILRDANWTLAGSRALRDAGHYQIGNLPLAARLLGLLLLYVEWLWMHCNPECGEEIVLIARKQKAPGGTFL